MWPFSTIRDLRYRLQLAERSAELNRERVDLRDEELGQSIQEVHTLRARLAANQRVMHEIEHRCASLMNISKLESHLIESMSTLIEANRQAFVEIFKELTPKSRADVRRMARRAEGMIAIIDREMTAENGEADEAAEVTQPEPQGAPA